MATAGPRKTISIHDYPEHLNPFREDDNHNKIRFWTLGRKMNRSNSINFSGIKDLKNSWAFRSFMKKGKKGETKQKENKTQENEDASPIMFRRALQYSSMSRAGSRSTVASPERYVYGGSVTPLPRSRFQERLRSSSQHEGMMDSPRMARSEISGSRLSVGSSNPFDEPAPPARPVPPARASRRKKKRAPPPPAALGEAVTAADASVSSETSELKITEAADKKPEKPEEDLELDETNLNIELKIVEDDDDTKKNKEPASPDTSSITNNTVEVTLHSSLKDEKEKEEATQPEKHENNNIPNANSEENGLDSVPFQKVDIVKYRRNSSVNEDDIRLRRGNLEDFHPLTNKRSKSLNNTDTTFVTYDINLNENTKDRNGNESPQKVVCKLYEDSPRKQSIDNSISSTEREFLEIDRVRREFETEINKLNAALERDDFSSIGWKKSVSEIKRNFENDVNSPNPIPKPRRSHYSDSGSPINDTPNHNNLSV